MKKKALKVREDRPELSVPYIPLMMELETVEDNIKI